MLYPGQHLLLDMLSRAWFSDEDDMVSDDEEVGEDFFGSTNMTTRSRSSPALNEFDESGYERESL